MGPAARADTSPARPDIRDPGVDNGGDFPNGAGVVGPGAVQAEFVGDYQRASGTSSFALPALVRIGLVEDLELRVGASVFDYQSTSIDSTAGAGPISIGGKYQLRRDGPESIVQPSAVGIEAQVQLPVGTSEFDGDVAQPSATLNLDYDFPQDFSGSLNIGAAAPVDGNGDQFLQACVQWSFTYSLSRDLQLYVNGLTDYPAASSGGGTVTLLGGGWMSFVGDRFAFYGSYNVGVTDESPDTCGSVGFALLF